MFIQYSPGPSRSSLRRGPLESELVAIDVDADRVTRMKASAQQLVCQRIFDAALDRALQRPRTIHRVITLLGQSLERLLAQLEAEVLLLQPRTQRSQLNFRNSRHVLAAERMKHDDVVDPIQKLGSKMHTHHSEHRRLDRFVTTRFGQRL